MSKLFPKRKQCSSDQVTMNRVLTFSALIAVALCSPVPQNGSDVVGPAIKVDESDIIYWFFRQEGPTYGVAITRQTVSALNATSYDSSKETVFVVHGLRTTNTSNFISTVRPALVANVDSNIFVVDWSKIAAQSYIPARNSVREVGRLLAKFIERLVSTRKLSLSRTVLVGHSSGAHVAGVAGFALNGRVSIIIGLDPALPLFTTSALEDRLDPSDADFVQVIHTNGELKGFLSPIGDSDYYPNGGIKQPGCGSDVTGTCAHARAYQYYAESLGGGVFLGVSCESYLKFSNNSCADKGTSLMGTGVIDTIASGRYYLNTNSESPFWIM